MILVLAVAAAAVSIPLFKVYSDDNGTLLSATADDTLNKNNKFFDPALGNNDQSCATCHQPFDGFTISLDSINAAFQATGGTDPLFRPNDTANDPNDPNAQLGSGMQQKQTAYSLFLELGVARIGKGIPAVTDFRIEPQNSPVFGDLPKTDDPQIPGGTTLSCFRRPLVNTNVHLDSSVLWDGRTASPTATNMRAQVGGAVRTLLLGSTPSDADADNVAAFMLGVFTDQVSDNAAGNLASAGATSGVNNLLAQAQACTAPNCPQPGGTTVFTLFNAWSTLSDNNAQNVARLAIARGEQVFDTQVNAGGFGCRGCHNASNLGNNSSATFFRRIGTDSLDILDHLIAGDGVVAGSKPNPDSAEIQSLMRVRDRVAKLPVYCLRPNTDTTSFEDAPCGTHASDVKTTESGKGIGKWSYCRCRAIQTPNPAQSGGTVAILPQRKRCEHRGSNQLLQCQVQLRTDCSAEGRSCGLSRSIVIQRGLSIPPRAADVTISCPCLLSLGPHLNSEITGRQRAPQAIRFAQYRASIALTFAKRRT